MWWVSTILLNLLIMINFRAFLMISSRTMSQMSLNQYNCSSSICVVLSFESFWTASNDICVLHMCWINSLILRSVSQDLSATLCLKCLKCLMLCLLLFFWLSVLLHLLKCVSLDWPSGRVSGWHFGPEPRSGRVAHIFNPTRPDPTENWVNPTRPAKDPSLAPRGLNIEIFPAFALPFCITFLVEGHDGEHKGEHEGRLIGGHDGEHKGEHKGEHGGKYKGEHGGRLVEEHGGKHKGEHGGEHGGEHEGKTWRPFDFGRESWRGIMVGSHEGNHEGCSTKLFTPI